MGVLSNTYGFNIGARTGCEQALTVNFFIICTVLVVNTSCEYNLYVLIVCSSCMC